jgi:mannose-1-phosphate guanylyltransferase
MDNANSKPLNSKPLPRRRREDAVRIAPVILAGGSGTRFWPRSRRSRAKQVLELDGGSTMIQQTLARLTQLAAPAEVWVITNSLLAGTIAAQLPEISADKILKEPAARNTAPAAGLAAMLIERNADFGGPDTVVGLFPADQVVLNAGNFANVLREGAQIAASGENIVVLGVAPTRPETGYGYIETSGSTTVGGIATMTVRRFTEKPDPARAKTFVAAGNFLWNSGIFLCTARTLANAIREYCPKTAPLLEQIASYWGKPEFDAVFAALYPQCENISIDYAVMEPRSARPEPNIYCMPAEFGWTDLGSWAALYEHKAGPENPASGGKNIVEAADAIAPDASGNYVYAPGKSVALLGVKDLVVVETEDALLITTRAHSQEVGKIVKLLGEKGRGDLL